MGDSRRFMPYGVYVPRHSVHGVVEAGPSTQRYPHIPYGTLPTIQPTGRIPETTANAEQNELTTEEEESSVSGFYCSPIPHVADCLLDVRRPRPDSPAAKGHHASTVGGPRRVLTGYGHGRRSRGGTGRSRATRTR